MKKKEIKNLTEDETKKNVETFKKNLFNLRFKKVNGQLEDTAKVSQIKKNIARLLTKMGSQKKHD